MSRTIILAAALSAMFAGTAIAAGETEHKATYFDFAKITVAERARADGFLRVRVTPENGTAREGTVDIHRRMSENDIAKSIAVALEPVVGPDYAVERTAGEHVKLKKANKSAANFNVEITFNVPGFSIVLEN